MTKALLQLTTCIAAISLVVSGVLAGNDPRYSLSLDRAQFKATHNSYKLSDLPNVQIDKYDVWEIELDFGYSQRFDDFVVGHSKPEPRDGLSSLREWFENVMAAESLKEHPIVLKLEAKTNNPARISHSSERFARGTFWPAGWQTLLIDSLTQWIGAERLITPERFASEYNSQWPTVEKLAGMAIVTLQDNNDNYYVSKLSDQLFIDSIPGLAAWWPPVRDSAQFRKAVESGVNRITLDGAYSAEWATMGGSK